MEEFFIRKAESWCFCSQDPDKIMLVEKLQCTCGEENKIFEWNWEDNLCSNVVLSNGNRDVLFHPIYSSGTAAVKGEQTFKRNVYYYWEIKVLTNLYGTDVMIGVATSKLTLPDWKLRFCSMLGYNMESWGYSYTGKIQHNRLTCTYGSHFSIGSLVGVYLDMCTGTLEYYLNRRPLGIAFRNLKNYELHPIVCSTAAQSAMRITCCLSQAPSLQIECLKIIGKNHALLEHLRKIPGIMQMMEKKYFWLIPPTPVKDKQMSMDLEDECVVSLDTLNQNIEHRKRFCSNLLQLRVNANIDCRCYLTTPST